MDPKIATARKLKQLTQFGDASPVRALHAAFVGEGEETKRQRAAANTDDGESAKRCRNCSGKSALQWVPMLGGLRAPVVTLLGYARPSGPGLPLPASLCVSAPVRQRRLTLAGLPQSGRPSNTS